MVNNSVDHGYFSVPSKNVHGQSPSRLATLAAFTWWNGDMEHEENQTYTGSG